VVQGWGSYDHSNELLGFTKTGNFLTSWTAVWLSRRTLYRGVR
jgi:hypothetical protein